MKRKQSLRSSRRFAHSSGPAIALLLVCGLLVFAAGQTGRFDLHGFLEPKATPSLQPEFIQFETGIVAPAMDTPQATSTPRLTEQTTRSADASEPALDPEILSDLQDVLDDLRDTNEGSSFTPTAATPAPTPAPTPKATWLTGSSGQTFTYVVHGRAGAVDFTTYAGLNDYLAGLPRTLTYTPGITPKPSTRDFLMRNLDEPNQDPELKAWAERIRQLSPNPDEQARIAISLVQQIPYDTLGVRENRITGKYPYEVLHTHIGVCQEKSELLVFLLRELGFKTAIFRYEAQNHETAGVGCAPEYDYRDSGYCFIETTGPAISTYSTGNYAGIGTLTSVAETVAVSDGRSMDLSEEFADAQAYERLVHIGPVLKADDYAMWQSLRQKYGIGRAG